MFGREELNVMQLESAGKHRHLAGYYGEVFTAATEHVHKVA